MSVSPPVPDRSNKMARLIDDCTRDLGATWRSRNRYESAAIGAIELAFRRGYQAGFEDAAAGRKPADNIALRK